MVKLFKRGDLFTMFFIGIFGIDEVEKRIRTYNNAICPACNSMTHFEISKSYSYFHIFFIPTFRWNVKYYVRPVCCGIMYELDPVIGKQFSHGQSPKISKDNLCRVNNSYNYKICSSCNAEVELNYGFCPYCGRKL